MKELISAPLLILVLVTFGCKSTSGTAGEPAAISNQTSRASANELPALEGEFDMEGHFYHAPSGTHFPPAVGVFERSSAHRYSIEEENFSFRYLAGGLEDGLKVDVYVYPRDDKTAFVDTDQWLGYLGGKMAGVVGGMRHHYADVTVVEAVGYHSETATGKMWWIATEATFVDAGVPRTSWAYTAAHRGWFYKMRMSTESYRADAGRKLQKYFFDRFNKQIEVSGAQPD